MSVLTQLGYQPGDRISWQQPVIQASWGWTWWRNYLGNAARARALRHRTLILAAHASR